jgi:serine/threonine protein kinase
VSHTQCGGGRYGLAKLHESADHDETRTTSQVSTRPGLLMGTVPYMSPEQASGGTIDSRSDIFSLGAVLHETLSGQRPFTGSTDLEVLQKVAPMRTFDITPDGRRIVFDRSRENSDILLIDLAPR